jgi:hypothetical protein
MARREELTDEQWAVLEPLIPATVRRADSRGRPQLHSDRTVLNGILWVLHRRCLGRSARSVPVRMHLLQTLYPLGQVRRDATDPGKPGPAPGRNGPD